MKQGLDEQPKSHLCSSSPFKGSSLQACRSPSLYLPPPPGCRRAGARVPNSALVAQLHKLSAQEVAFHGQMDE